ncbi:MAG: S1 family peptidase [Actinocatenispora sp.]
MTSGRARTRAAGLAVAATGALVAAGFAGAPAQAAAPMSTAVQHAAVHQASIVNHQVGADTGGTFLDANGHAVINVTNAADAQTVHAAGLRYRTVKHSFAQLTATKESLDKLAGIADTAWGIDTRANEVVLSISSSTPKAGAAQLTAAAKKFGDQVRIRHTSTHYETFVQGGDAIQNDQGRCSDGFNVVRGGELMVLTAGHCTELGGTWSPMGGTVAESNGAPADEGLITNPSGDGPSSVNTGQTISSVGAPTVGESVTKSGSTTGVTDGTISAVDQTVNFDVGVLTHLFETDVHSDHGDSGGPGYDGSTALGTLTGGDTTTTYFYPAQIEFSDYGLSLP